MKKTAVIFESFEGSIRTASWEAFTCARAFSTADDNEILPILLNGNASAPASEISAATGLPVIAVNTTSTTYNSDHTKSILVALCQEMQITHICLAGTTQGLDYAPGLAVRLETPCISGVEAVSVNGEGICLERSIYGGKMVETCTIENSGAIIITQPGTFKPFQSETTSDADVDLRSDHYQSNTISNLEVRQVQKESSDLALAPVIIAAGRGVKEQENLELIEQLAGVFAKSAVGGSRPLCDLEWLEYKQQVGITGATVTPDLYLACGISGAAQHISGMRNAGFIVSVNIDPKAAIFNYSDVCIVEDLTTFIPVFIETVEKRTRV